MKLVEDQVETEAGNKLIYAVVRKKPFVIIIPWDGKCLALVRQYRYPIDAVSLEFPQGYYEHASIKEMARTELRQETGLRAAKIREIGRIHIAPGFCSQEGIIFLASGLGQGETEREQSEEDMEVARVDLDEFRQMLKQGKITDSSTIAAWGLLMAKDLLE